MLQLQDRYPRDLSSGEQQRAALAAVIAGNPSLILLDEPTRGMDPPARRAIGAIVAGAKDRGAAVVIATHDSDLAAEIADRVVMLDSGDARDLGPPSTALTGDTPYATTIARLFDGAAVTVDDAVNLIRAQHHIDAPLMRR